MLDGIFHGLFDHSARFYQKRYELLVVAVGNHSICKEAVNHLAANKTPTAVTRIGKVVGVVSSTLDHYDEVTRVDHGSDRHTPLLDKKPMKFPPKWLCIDYITRWRSLRDLHTEGQRPEAV